MQIIAANDNRSMANYIETLVKACISKYEQENGAIIPEAN